MRFLQHSVTGQAISVDDSPDERSKYLFRLACRALDLLGGRLGLEFYVLSLTQNPKIGIDAMNRDIHGFLTWIRNRLNRAGLRFLYVWVVELQLKRFLTYGEKALHWHVVIACPRSALPDVEFVQDAPKGRKYQMREEGEVIKQRDLFKRWGRGHVLCGVRRSPSVYGYLSKYFGKDWISARGARPEWARLRRWGSSQMGHYKFPKWAFDVVDERIGRSEYAGKKFRKEGGRVNVYEWTEIVCWNGFKLSPAWCKVESFRSPWRSNA